LDYFSFSLIAFCAALLVSMAKAGWLTRPDMADGEEAIELELADEE
jgi:hypothetical protein